MNTAAKQGGQSHPRDGRRRSARLAAVLALSPRRPPCSQCAPSSAWRAPLSSAATRAVAAEPPARPVSCEDRRDHQRSDDPRDHSPRSDVVREPRQRHGVSVVARHATTRCANCAHENDETASVDTKRGSQDLASPRDAALPPRSNRSLVGNHHRPTHRWLFGTFSSGLPISLAVQPGAPSSRSASSTSRPSGPRT